MARLARIVQLIGLAEIKTQTGNGIMSKITYYQLVANMNVPDSQLWAVVRKHGQYRTVYAVHVTLTAAERCLAEWQRLSPTSQFELTLVTNE